MKAATRKAFRTKEQGALTTRTVKKRTKHEKTRKKAATGDESAGGLTAAQKAVLGLAALLIGPSLLLGLYEKATTETVDLSTFNLVTQYETPAIEMMDDTARIQFCSS
mmetsp:Transcript_42834/g.69163  ORF Transcript_42834/g.69163 Transcript_42834/m.69163 type:complete len:108 (-) Transcript_42834:25-348(-)